MSELTCIKIDISVKKLVGVTALCDLCFDVVGWLTGRMPSSWKPCLFVPKDSNWNWNRGRKPRGHWLTQLNFENCLWNDGRLKVWKLNGHIPEFAQLVIFGKSEVSEAQDTKWKCFGFAHCRWTEADDWWDENGSDTFYESTRMIVKNVEIYRIVIFSIWLFSVVKYQY